jgi:hypothetical protein
VVEFHDNFEMKKTCLIFATLLLIFSGGTRTSAEEISCSVTQKTLYQLKKTCVGKDGEKCENAKIGESFEEYVTEKKEPPKKWKYLWTFLTQYSPQLDGDLVKIANDEKNDWIADPEKNLCPNPALTYRFGKIFSTDPYESAVGKGKNEAGKTFENREEVMTACGERMVDLARACQAAADENFGTGVASLNELAKQIQTITSGASVFLSQAEKDTLGAEDTYDLDDEKIFEEKTIATVISDTKDIIVTWRGLVEVGKKDADKKIDEDQYDKILNEIEGAVIFVDSLTDADSKQPVCAQSDTVKECLQKKTAKNASHQESQATADFVRERMMQLQLEHMLQKSKSFPVSNVLRVRPDSREADLVLIGGDDEKNINLFDKVIRLVAQILGTFAVLMFVISAVYMIVSQGNEQQLQRGKQIFIYTFLGLLVAFGSYTAVQFFLDLFLW